MQWKLITKLSDDMQSIASSIFTIKWFKQYNSEKIDFNYLFEMASAENQELNSSLQTGSSSSVIDLNSSSESVASFSLAVSNNNNNTK